jgi:hypothetical protein
MLYNQGAMSGLKNKMGLTIDSTVWNPAAKNGRAQADLRQPRVHKKYLGEPNDLHFIPSSPLIERRAFSEQEEGELKRMCALALAYIPHSDDMSSDDPLKYLAAQIIVKPPPTAKPDAAPPPPFLPEVPAIPVAADTATPSDGSKRDTMDRTDYSTPLTSAGITPGESRHRFSDAGKRPPSSKMSSNLKHETASRTKSRAQSSSRSAARKSNDNATRKSQEPPKSSSDQRTFARSIRLVQEPRPLSETDARPVERGRQARYSQMELNKELPPLPRAGTEPVGRVHISRMMKIIKPKKSQNFDEQSPPLSTFPTMPFESPKTKTPKPRQKSMPTLSSLSTPPPTEPKRNFKRLFLGNRKEKSRQDVTSS